MKRQQLSIWEMPKQAVVVKHAIPVVKQEKSCCKYSEGGSHQACFPECKNKPCLEDV